MSVLASAKEGDRELPLADGLASLVAVQPAHALGLDALSRSAVPVAAALARGVSSLQAAAAAGWAAPPAAVERCHAALGVLYTLLTRHGDALLGGSGEGTLGLVVDACLSCLQRPSVSRESSLTAAVTLTAAICMRLSDGDAAAVLASALFGQSEGEEEEEESAAFSAPSAPSSRAQSLVDARVLRPRGSTLARELRRCTVFCRLCLLKALLAAAPPGALLLRLRRPRGRGGEEWTLLCDGALPELCRGAEQATCAHERFHSASGCAACVAKLLALNAQRAPGTQPAALPGPLGRRLEAVVWGGWEDPQPQVVHALQALFDSLLSLNTDCEAASQDGRDAALRAALALLRCGARKGKWQPLGSMVRRVRGAALLAAAPGIVDEVLSACTEDTVCTAAAGFLRILCEDLVSGWAALEGSAAAHSRLLSTLEAPLLRALLSAEGRLRSHVGSYLLPTLLCPYPALASHLLAALTGAGAERSACEADGDAVAAAAVTLLRPARTLGLCSPEGAHALLLAPGGAPGCTAPEQLLIGGCTHASPAVRLDCLELLCCNPRSVELPSPIEARLLLAALPLALQGGCAPVRNRVAQLLRRLLPRVQAGLERARTAQALGGCAQRGGGRARSAPPPLPEDNGQRVACARALVPWLLGECLSGAYPGAPFERKFTALDTLAAVAECWSPQAAQARLTSGGDAWPYIACCLSPGWTSALLAAGVDSWDRVRERVAALLSRHAAPLPGLHSPAQLQQLLQWLGALCRSPRVRESDAAARLLCTLADKYVLQLRWSVRLPGALPGQAAGEVGPLAAAPDPDTPLPSAECAAVAYLEGLVEAVAADVALAQQDPVAASRRAFAHGTLLALRYALPALRLGAPDLAAQPEVEARARAALRRLLDVLDALTQLATAAVARPEAVGAGAAEVASEGAPGGGVGWGTYFGDAEQGSDEDGEGSDGEEGGGEVEVGGAGGPQGALAPRAQVVMTAAWLSMKEVSLLLGALAVGAPPRLLPPSALAVAGASLVDLLLVTKHNGVVDKARQGLAQLAAQLLTQRGAACDLVCAATPAAWAQALLTRLEDPEQGVRDLIRRSAGLPFALLALCGAEPVGVARAILPAVLARSLAAAEGGAALPACDTRFVPGVHGFNVLRVLLSDHELSADTASALQSALCCALEGFGSPHWAVRNAAGLLFAALCVRVTGALNAGCTGRRGVAACDFLARFPALASQLQRHLQPASAALHPSLALLARLRAAEGARGREEQHCADHLLCLVRAAAAAPHATVRALSARALVPLVPLNAAAAMAADILASLPSSQERCTSHNSLHGDLLHAAALVRACAPRPDARDFVEALGRLQWLATCRAPPVRAQHLSLLLLLCEQSAEGAPWPLLQAACDACEAAPASSLPGEALWRKQAALGRVALCLRACRDPQLRDAAAAALLQQLRDDPCYEARGAVLKALQRAALMGHLQLPLSSLRPALRALCVVNGHRKVVARALELLSSLAWEAGPGEWRTMEAAVGLARDERQRAAALRCLGCAVGASGGCDEAAAALLCHVGNASDYAATPEARQSAADALHASGLLLRPGDLGLRAWLLCMRLLEDEEEEVRGCATVAATAALRACAPAGAGRPESLLEEAVAHAAAAHAGEAAMHAWLLAASAGPPPARALRARGDLVRRLFDKEADNHHAEALRTAQLAAQQLRRLSALPAGLPPATLIQAAGQLAEAAAQAAPALGGRRRGWAGGLTCHEDVFLPLYRLLLTLWALAPALPAALDDAQRAQLLDAVMALCEALAATEELHPLLRDMALHAADALQLHTTGALQALRGHADPRFRLLFLLAE